MSFPTANHFIDFLQHTLIPDLRRSGLVETAKDFVKIVRYIKKGKAPQGYIDWLNYTLIPDLRDSGYDATADEFEEGIDWMVRGVDPNYASNPTGEKYGVYEDPRHKQPDWMVISYPSGKDGYSFQLHGSKARAISDAKKKTSHGVVTEVVEVHAAFYPDDGLHDPRD